MKLTDVCLSQLAQEPKLKSIQILQAKILQQLFKFNGLGFAELVLLTPCQTPKELSIQLRPLLESEMVIFDGEKYCVKDPWLVLNALIDEAEKVDSAPRQKVWEVNQELRMIRQKMKVNSGLV